ncbi:MAG: NUDIX domain-containing protein [Nitrospiraceae bacterium]|nr:NUDIX domain-containing protein [Nitrospiraceae bacterium]
MTSEHTEKLEIVDSEGKVIGLAERAELHRDPSLIHRVVHVLIFNRKGELLLQKRSRQKDVAPGKWDTSVGGHVAPGEGVDDAAQREMDEELGISGCELRYLYRYLFSNRRESELVDTFSCIYEGKIDFNKDEIDEVAFWGIEAIIKNLGSAIFSAHFEKEIRTYLAGDRR